MSITELEQCPKCGGSEGVYRKVTISGRTHYNYSFKGGQEADNSELHSSLRYNESKTIYCQQCDQPIAKVEKDDLLPTTQ